MSPPKVGRHTYVCKLAVKDLCGSGPLDGKGQRVEQFMDNHSLCFLNDGSYTYLHPGYGTYTAIDLTINQPNLLLDFSWRVLDDLCGSDHFPIVIKHQGQATSGREPGWRLKKADWHSFRTLCEERLTADIHNSPEAIASFTDALISIADKTVPKSSATPKHVVNPIVYLCASSEDNSMTSSIIGCV